jgi:hypothetical protein
LVFWSQKRKSHLSSPPVFSGVRVARSLVFCVMFCRSSFVLLSFFHWPFYCLPSFNLQFLIIPLVSSNLSYVVVLPYRYAPTKLSIFYIPPNDRLVLRSHKGLGNLAFLRTLDVSTHGPLASKHTLRSISTKNCFSIDKSWITNLQIKLIFTTI